MQIDRLDRAECGSAAVLRPDGSQARVGPWGQILGSCVAAGLKNCLLFNGFIHFRHSMSNCNHMIRHDILRKPRPDAGCMRCGRVYIGTVERTVMCTVPSASGMPCGGRITWRPNPMDWTECPVCAGTGVSADKTCQRCRGDGWLMGRH